MIKAEIARETMRSRSQTDMTGRAGVVATNAGDASGGFPCSAIHSILYSRRGRLIIPGSRFLGTPGLPTGAEFRLQ